jgi:hypothetical protein
MTTSKASSDDAHDFLVGYHHSFSISSAVVSVIDEMLIVQKLYQFIGSSWPPESSSRMAWIDEEIRLGTLQIFIVHLFPE